VDQPTDEYEVVTGEVQDIPSQELVEALPELARVAAVTWTRGAAWGLRVSLRVARAALDAEAATELADGVRGYARELLGVNELEHRVRELAPVSGDGYTEADLRARGEELLRRSADVSAEDGAHPAFARILSELAPDEARILRLLAAEGPQPVVDVRASNLIGAGSQLVAPNLNMLAMQAGCRHGDRVDTYLVNLGRLGLVRLSDEPIEDPIPYQVLEAQPYVLDAIRATARAKTVQRSVRLTAFGDEFCAACFGPQPTPFENVELGS
jgi:hypothetical protein